MSVPTSKPRLVAVDSPPESAPAAPPPDRDRRFGVWLFAGLLALALIALSVQTSRLEALGDQLDAVYAELASSQADVSAYQGHLDDVRLSVADLQARFADLDTLLGQDPVTGAAPGDSRPTPD